MMELWIFALVLFAASLVHALVVDPWRDGLRKAMSISPGQLGVPDTMTVIVPARNAALTLVPLLQDLHAQDLPKGSFDVLVVDDHSEDGTSEAVRGMMRTWPQLRCITNTGIGKKAAIATGVSYAIGTVILLTDADARCGPLRASTVLRWMSDGQLDLALCPVRTDGHGFLGRVQEDEQAGLLGMSIGEAIHGRPMLGNGANLAFRRSAFLEVGGYRNDRHASGDDVFLIQRLRQAGKRIGYVVDRNAIVSVCAETTLKGFVQQRLRWAGKMRSVAGTSMFAGSLSLLLPWFLLATTIHYVEEMPHGDRQFEAAALLIAAWSLWCVPVIALVRDVRTFLGQRNSTPIALVSFLLFTLYAPLIALGAIVVRPKWKGRRI